MKENKTNRAYAFSIAADALWTYLESGASFTVALDKLNIYQLSEERVSDFQFSKNRLM